MHRLHCLLPGINTALFACFVIFVFWRCCLPSSPKVEIAPAVSVWEKPASINRASQALPAGTHVLPMSQTLSMRMLAPPPNANVSQFGASVRFRVEGVLPVGSRPVIFLRDATGLATNWWVWDAYPGRALGEWEGRVQFGEAPDGGAHFAVAVLLLRDTDCPPSGSVGRLPAQALARSETVEVVRE